MNISSLREALTLILIALLPFHALLVTAGTKLILGPGRVPMASLAAWKEALLAMIILIAIAEILSRTLKSKWKIESGKLKVANATFIDWLDTSILVLLIIAAALYFHRPWMTTMGFLFGFKYDFVPLIGFLVLRRVPWSERFIARAEGLLLTVGGIVALYGIFTLFLPQSFLTLLGYSESHSLYLPNGPIAAFQHISGSGIRRIQSTFSGPNQFGVWLLIPVSVCLARMMQPGEKLKMKNEKWTTYNSLFTFHFSLLFFLGVAMILAFSRSAWIAAFVIGCVAAWRMVTKKFFAFCMASFLMLAIGISLFFPTMFVRPISLAGHAERPLKAVLTMIKHPFGLGLGSAGPAANRMSDSCVFLEQGSDPTWAHGNVGLCVFVGGEQVQPSDRRCDCPLLTENWYLQIGVELGVLGFLLYIGLILLILRQLCVVESGKCPNGRRVLPAPPALPQCAGERWSIVERPTFLFFVGISVAALFLHAWEDGAVAYTAWILAAAALHRQSLIQDRRN